MSAKLERMLKEELQINFVLRPVGFCPIFTLLYFVLWDFFLKGLYDRLCQKPLTDLEILPMVNLFCQDLSIFCQLIQILPVQ